MLTLKHNRSLVVAVALVASHELGQMIFTSGSVVILNHNFLGSCTLYSTGLFSQHAYTGVHCCLSFHTCSHNRGLCSQKRHGLTLHVGTHKGTVSIVILQERNQCGSHREHHLRRHVHVIKHMTLVLLCLFSVTTGYILMNKMSFCIQRLVSLSHMVIIFLVGSHIYYFIGNSWILGV